MTMGVNERKSARTKERPAARKFGVKAYGDWKEFDTIEEYCAYLLEWMAATEGAERDRAVEALVNLQRGVCRTDTDAA